MKNKRYITAMVGMLLMMGASTTAYGQIVKGRVFGGGQLAQVNAVDDETACNVTINSGEVYGEVFGAGEGVKIDDASFVVGDRPNVAKVTGNTKVNLGPGRGGGGTAWKDVFGGGALAKVAGDTYVSMTGGHIAANLFGGGMGDIKMNADGNAYAYVNNALVVTSADISGNTNVDIKGGDIIWNRTSVTTPAQGSITTYFYTKPINGVSTSESYETTNSEETVETIKASYEALGNTSVTVTSNGSETVDEVTTYKFTVNYTTPAKVLTEEVLSTNTESIAQLETLGYIRDDSKTKVEESNVVTGEVVYWNPENQSLADGSVDDKGHKYYNSKFYDAAKKQFLIKHNIFGGGYVACRVGTYDDEGNILNKKDGLGTDLTDDEGNVIPTGRARVSMVSGMFGADLMGTQQWKDCYDDKQDPHFYVFGGGFGAYTSVGKTQVQIGVDEEILEAAGETEEQWAKPGTILLGDETTAMRAKGSKFFGGDMKTNGVGGTDDDPEIGIADQRYGEPGYTILGVLGGGFAGIVTGNTDVRVGGNTFMSRIYGGGYGQLAAYNELRASDNISAGIPNWNTTREDLGMVKGNTYVKTDGGFIQGDVFGGGAGVESAWSNGTIYKELDSSNTTATKDFTMGEVKGATEVEITGSTFVLNSVYGGGDVANVLGGTVNTSDENAPQHTSTVTLNGGTVIQNVFGGGSGRLTTKVANVTDNAVAVGKIVGETLVTIEDIKNDETGEVTSTPVIYGGIYGGGAYGQIVKTAGVSPTGGNTYVNINGGKIGGDIFGGGLGKVDGSNITSANIAGNTNVTVNGGSYLWDVVVDANGNEKTFDKTSDVNMKAVKADATQRTAGYYILKAEDVFSLSDMLFKNKSTGEFTDHNIYGGGNTACVSGEANVTINHGMLDDNLGYADSDTWSLGGFLRYLILDNKEHPQFAVLGGGYGPKTTVASTDVKIQIDKDNVSGYDNTADKAKWDEFYNGLQDEFNALDPEAVAELYGGSVGANTFARYLSSRMCWTFGVPNHTVLTVAGGGMAGYVTDDTNVTLSNHSGALQVFGGGIGIQPTTGLATQSAADAYTYGQVGGNTTVDIKGGVISRGVYGGGAGIAPVKVDGAGKVLANQKADGTYRDFTNIARVLGKTDVTIDGYTTGTLVFGAVYGGGDVANVGISQADKTADDAKAEAERVYTGKVATEVTAQQRPTVTFTDPQANVTIKGGIVYGEIFGGGYGRTIDVCSDYQKLGAVYGNTRVTLKNSKYTQEEADHENAAHEGMSDWTTVTTSSDKTPWTWARIYGGGSYGKIYGNTDVQIQGGNIGYNVFGAGVGFVGSKKGVDSDGDEIDIPVLTSADVTGNANLSVTGGEFCVSQMWYPEERAWGRAHNFEGKTYSSQYDPELKKFLINHNLYAGSRNCGKVLGDTYLTMTKGLINGQTALGHDYDNSQTNAFFGEPEWKSIYEKIGSPHFSVFGAGYGENTTVEGDTHVNIAFTGTEINAAEIDAAVAASTDEEEQTYKLFKSYQSLMDIIGGGYSGQVLGKTNVDINGETFIRRAFGGSFYAPVGQTNITVNQVSADDIFGGGMMGDVTNVAGTSVPEGLRGNVNLRVGTPGSNKNDKIFINNNVYGGNDVSGEVTGQITASIFGGKIYNNVYGAGNGNYLYALNRNLEKVTTHEYYEANGQTYDLVYEVPARKEMDLNRNPTEAQKIVDINIYRPMAENVVLNIAGTSTKPLTIGGNVFGGGNTATVSALNKDHRPSVTMNIGSYCTIGGVYMGADGEAMFQEKNGFMGAFQNINGVDLTNAIDWLGNMANKSISEEFLPVAMGNRPKIYPHVLDLYFQPVEMAVQPTLNWCNDITYTPATNTVTATPNAANLTNTTIGTFVCGGNRGNMNVEPWNGTTANYGGNVTAAGQIINYQFPAGLTIQNRIVGGCNNANYTLGNVTHEGGYLLGGRKNANKEINLLVECQFAPQATAELVAAAKGNNEKIAELSAGNVFGGCYKSGTINGDVCIDVRSDMLKNINDEVLKASKDNNVPLACVYGAGYGMESYVYGETEVLFGKGTKSSVSSAAKPMGQKKAAPSTIIYGSTANDVYGGGQQGNLIGNSTIKILNGHIAGSVVGGSYAGYMWGSTQVLVGYPKYYTVNKSGTYNLKRADKWNVGNDYKNADGSDAVKQSIKLIAGDIIAEEVYDAINDYDATHTQTSASQFSAAYQMTPAHDSGSGIKWDDINIKIDDAAYGGGYSLASGSSVGSQTYTVLKYNDEHNLDADMTSGELSTMNGSSKKFGGNTTVLVWDHAKASYTDDADGSTQDKEHIAISTQEMTQVTTLKEGDDLFGLYYWDDGSKSYKYIFQEGKYKYGTGSETGITYYQSAFKYDGDGGVYGDGHLSFAEGFRAGEVNGYGFAGSNPAGAKILNTFQRLDMLRVSDCSLVLLGACDYTVNEISTTPYSIARVGELQMKSQNVVTDGTTLKATNNARSRNFVGLSNNIHYVGAVTSDVPFNANFHDRDGVEKNTATYRAEKQSYIDGYYNEGANKGQKGIFQRRNDGTAKNMIGIASGFPMKIQNTKTTDAKGTEVTFYGPIIGVVEVALTNTHADEAGAYVYAANLHRRDAATAASDPNFVPVPHVDDEDFLETTGNFVFPYNADENRYVIDDCDKTEYDAQGTKEHGYPIDGKAEAHKWFVAGWEYYYNAHITGYTYNDPNTFYAENDGAMTLVGTIADTEVKVESIKWRSNHANAAQDELETRNTNNTDVDADKSLDASGHNVYGAYKLYIGTSSDKKYDATTENKPDAGAYYGADNKRNSLSFKTPGTLGNTNYGVVDQPMLGTTQGAEDNILIALQDDADNHGKEYFNAHFAEPCEATIVLSAPAKNSDGTAKYKYTADAVVTSGSTIPADHYVYNETTGEYDPASGTAADGVTYFTKAEGRYTYTIYLTIDYVMGPNYTGNIQVENCALPGEMIKVSLGNLEIESDPSMPAFGYNWKFGPRTYDSENNRWEMDHEKAYTYKVGTPFDPEADSNETSEMLAGVKYNKDGNYIEVPAYYFMNGYGVEYNFNVTGINETDTHGNVNPKPFSVAMRDQDQLTVHNYHRMKPRNADGVNRAPVDFKLDEALKRINTETTAANAMPEATEDERIAKTNALRAILPEPRIYIADASDLNELPRFLGEKAKTYYTLEEYNTANSTDLPEAAFAALPSTKKVKGEDVVGSKYEFGNHMQFHLLNDIVVNNVGISNLQADHYAEQGATNFKGTLNGNGYVISDLGVKKGDFTAPTYLFAANEGNIYNLGLKQGVITKGDAPVNGTQYPKYHTSYTWSDKTVYRMDGTAVATTADGAGNTYTENDWRYGKVTYDLNQYYLEARKTSLASDPRDPSEVPTYVEDLFHNGDYLYARWKTASSEYLRTADASQYDANYNSLTTYHYYNLTDGVLTHPIDESRAVNYNAEDKTFDCYAPLYEAAKNTDAATTTVVKNDYLFFGQTLDADTKAAKIGVINVTLPEHIDADVTRNVALMNNRVYRAGGYYKSHVSGEPYSTSGGAFFYNKDAFAHDNGITAIDFYGYPASATTWYSPMVDYPTARLESMDRANGVTRNLLVYANNEDDVTTGALKPYVYDEETSEGNIKMHVIKPAASPTTAYLHLVERTKMGKDAEGNTCLNNDFDTPIEFDVTQRAWYTRQPLYYANSNNDAWEGIVLPFTATKVEASLNGEITHFYGTPTGDELTDPKNDFHTLHHEYWLRGLTNVKTGVAADGPEYAGKKIAVFQRPGTESGLFGSSFSSGSSYSSLASIPNLVFNNTWFKDTYGENNYNTSEPQNVWYTTEHTYTDYMPLTKDVPYIVSFPGERYYEFDLSSKFYNDKMGESEKAQTITFNWNTVSDSKITIAETSEMKTTQDSYNHLGVYLQTNDDEAYFMDAKGVKFDGNDPDNVSVLPFRTYIKTAASGAKPMSRCIIIGGESEQVTPELEKHGDISNGGVAEKTMVAYSIKRNIIIESDLNADVVIYTAAGQVARAVKVFEGNNTYAGFVPGVYIVNGKKLVVR